MGQGALVELRPFSGGLSLRAAMTEFSSSPEQAAFYRDTAAYGHFGRTDLKLHWEDVSQKATELQEIIKDSSIN